MKRIVRLLRCMCPLTSLSRGETASNWSPARLPTSTDDVVISLDGTCTVTLDVDASVACLTMGGRTGTQTLSLPRTLTLSGAGSIGPHGALDLPSLAGSLGWQVLCEPNAVVLTNVSNGFCLESDLDGFDVCAGGCTPRPGDARGDCDDQMAGVNPTAAEACDLIDNNGNGSIDEGFGSIPEVCNGLDECDGEFDEQSDADGIGDACDPT